MMAPNADVTTRIDKQKCFFRGGFRFLSAEHIFVAINPTTISHNGDTTLQLMRMGI